MIKVLAILIAYLLGSIPVSVLVSKLIIRTISGVMAAGIPAPAI